jgi:hypothetical protein
MSVAAAVAESSEIAGTDFYGAKVEVDLADTAIVIAPRPVNFQRAREGVRAARWRREDCTLLAWFGYPHAPRAGGDERECGVFLCREPDRPRSYCWFWVWPVARRE